ncbi:glutathione S-transferase A-like protein [Labeo rohita]|uniref:Glutathione S-transferase A-like protein n=1 Tax=Labeo rohita TaxID=84645 RepID=A0A498MB16_LABRO|nr:glutathione S-transferase A-like [Labeo rohita]RXN17043.1 glutathione S-transferase A-like protein [Labeo rohita]
MAQNIMLYWTSGSPPCWRVMIALEEKLLQGYKQKHLSFEKNEHKCEEVKALNPRGQVPTFKHGDIVVNESFAACLYLESTFKSQGTRLIPDDPAEQALVYQRIFETENLQQKLSYVAFYEWYVPEGERLESALKRNKENLITELKLWEGYLEKMGKGSYLAGKNFTMADVVCFPVIAYLPYLHCPKERCPRLMEYYEMVKDRPSIKASWPPHWLEKPEGQDTLKNL